MPEKLMNRCLSMFFVATVSQACLVDMQQPFTLTLFCCCQHAHCCMLCIARFNFTHQVKHDRPANHRVNDHLLPLFSHSTQGLDNIVAGIMQQFGIVILLQHSLLFNVSLE